MTHRSFTRRTLEAAVVLCVAASAMGIRCEQTVGNPSPTPRDGGLGPCGADACGPALGVPNFRCADGSTGGPTCVRDATGVCAWRIRECPDAGQVCGTIAGIGCPAGYYCDYALGEGCGVADGSGLCAQQPELCAQVYEPVCGCDGETYGNACEAAAAGVSVAAPGLCPTP